jgi:hypothetical protein
VPVLQKPAAQCLRYVARSNDADFHALKLPPRPPRQVGDRNCHFPVISTRLQLQRLVLVTGLRMKPVGVVSNANCEPPTSPYFRRNATGIVTRPRVENRTL